MIKPPPRFMTLDQSQLLSEALLESLEVFFRWYKATDSNHAPTI